VLRYGDSMLFSSWYLQAHCLPCGTHAGQHVPRLCLFLWHGYCFLAICGMACWTTWFPVWYVYRAAMQWRKARSLAFCITFSQPLAVLHWQLSTPVGQGLQEK